MNITTIGTGYVGLVTGVCLSNVGNRVICFDIDRSKIDLLNSGKVPIYEPGLQTKLKSSIKSRNLSFTSNPKKSINSSEIIMICVGTPSKSNGDTDLKFVNQAADMIAEYIDSDKIILIKSTVPVGTSEKIKKNINEKIKKRNINCKIDLIFNPEFLKEGKAINDFESPDRIVIGYESTSSLKKVIQMYEPFNLHHDKIITMDIKSSELTKYASNAFLATKISFINEIANICENVDADINSVRKGLCSDTRIGYDFMYPGVGFGGSCFPKDLKALSKFSKDRGYQTSIIDSVIEVNDMQRMIFAEKIIKYFEKKSISGHIAIWGLSYKPETDDVRKAPSIDIIKKLLEKNFPVKAYDPVAMKNFNKKINHKKMSFGKNLYDVLEGANALVLLTEWNEFRSPNFSRVKELMNTPVLFDGKNIYNKENIESLGFECFQVGVRT